MIYFIHGPDRLLAHESALAIVAEIDPDGSNTSWLDGREITVDRIVSIIGSTTFFGTPRIVLVSDLLTRASKEPDSTDPSDEMQSSRPRGSSGLESLIAAVPDQNVLILFEPNLNSVPASFRSTAPQATIIAGEPPRGRALIDWLERAALRSESQIDGRTAQRLAESIYPQTWDRKPNNPRYDRPPDMAHLSQEIEKLALAAHPGPITDEHIAALTSSGPDQRVFRFLDAALAADLRGALHEMELLSAAGEEPAMLLAQLLGQVELASVAAAAGDKGADMVARDLGTVAPGRMSAVMASTRRLGIRAQRAAEVGSRTDRGLKTGRIRKPEEALHDVVLGLGGDGTGTQNGRSR